METLRPRPSRAIVAGEYRLFRAIDGHYYAESVYGYSFWRRYLETFEEVLVVARVTTVEDAQSMLRVTGPSVHVFEMPYFVGLAGYVRARRELRSAAQRLSQEEGAVILRAPGNISTAVASALPKDARYAVEVVGDPAEVFAKGVVDPPMRRVLRWKATRDLRRVCRGACAIAYVSRYQLEARYPASPGAITFAYSSAAMSNEAFAAVPRAFDKPLRSVIAIGSMDQLYKGFDVLIQCVPGLQSVVPGLRLTIVGGGKYAQNLREMALDLGVAESITFSGIIRDPAGVREQLDKADIFVSSSRTEGLPRTVIEAQARGLPCLGTRVGATPDLLNEQDMCPPDDVQALQNLLRERLCDPVWATIEAARGWQQSQTYREATLQGERNRMFRALQDACEQR